MFGLFANIIYLISCIYLLKSPSYGEHTFCPDFTEVQLYAVVYRHIIKWFSKKTSEKEEKPTQTDIFILTF